MKQAGCYLIGHLVHGALLAFILWRAYRAKMPRIFLVYTCMMLYMVEFEVYRELLRCLGEVVNVTPWRTIYYRLIYFVWGLYYGLLTFYHEQFTGDLVQARHPS
jgi:hypothetical protein